MKNLIDYSFIHSLEGFETFGYVPKDSKDGIESGVTVGAGVDLGQHTFSWLKSLGLAQDLYNKLSTYIGLKGKSARDKVKSIPLVLTKAEAELLTNKVYDKIASSLVAAFDKISKTKYFSLDKPKQTVVFSVCVQYGDLKSRTPNFWKQVTQGRWNDALDNLRNFGDDYSKRRNKEADLLQTSLTK